MKLQTSTNCFRHETFKLKKMSKRVQLTDIREDEEDQDLKDVIRRFIKKSQELEKRESKVLKQVELVQSAINSLQTWNRKVSAATSQSVRVDVKEIEEESKKIKEETERIQKEVRRKIEENKKLQDEIERRKSMDNRKEDDIEEWVDKQERIKIQTGEVVNEEVEPRTEKRSISLTDDFDPGIQFFNSKLQKLREMKDNLEIESELRPEEARNNMKSFNNIQGPEQESNFDKRLIDTWKEKLEKK